MDECSGSRTLPITRLSNIWLTERVLLVTKPPARRPVTRRSQAMILTTCAACAKALDHDAPAHCVNCQTRYCSDRCLRYHAHRGGHDDACDEIARGGGAEQYHADKKYKEAVADAVEECAEDTEGQT